jgi:hypothetical protein
METIPAFAGTSFSEKIEPETNILKQTDRERDRFRKK